MERKLDYLFDDEIANKFCYDMDNKKIEIHFGGYYDVSSSHYIEKPCVWVIENWSDAKSKLSSENAYNGFEQHFGIVSMILSVEIKQTTLEVTINTLDNRYVDLLFDNPQIKFV